MRERTDANLEHDGTVEPTAAQPPPVPLLELQRAAGNAAVARMLARQTASQTAREKHGMAAFIDDLVNSGEDRAQDDPGMGPVDLAMEGLANFFGTPDDQPMKRVLLAHYAHGKGPLVLTLEQMHQMPTRLDLFAPSYSAAMAPFVEKVQRTNAPAIVSAKVLAQNNELGNFTVLVEGTLYPRDVAPGGVPAGRPHDLPGLKPALDDGAMPMRFVGKMSWYDYWDFDAKLAQTLEGSSHRPLGAEIGVIGVRTLINGRPFDVRSEWVDVTQDRGALPLW